MSKFANIVAVAYSPEGAIEMKAFVSLFLLLTLCASMSFGVTHLITGPGFTFSPSSLTINLGDTVQFSLASIHNAVELNQATWNANGTTSNGGFVVPFGGGTLVLTHVGTYYYICQAHAFFAMKGIITVQAANPASNTITIESVVDGDGSLATTTDRVLKNWNLKLYKDSVGSGIVVGAVASGISLTVSGLTAGTYVAVEADSAGWSHISAIVDAVPQGPTAVHQWSFTVTINEVHVIDFINFAPRTIVNIDFVFSPDSLVVVAGDTVHFVLDDMHKPREVSGAVWLANDTVSNGGFDLPYGSSSVVLREVGKHYYVCVPHASIAMKGVIVVLAGFSMNLAPGWNMISLPISVADARPTILFPTATSRAFRYQGTYIEQSPLVNGFGYWLKFPSQASAPLAGSTIAAETLAVAKGWNMIGPVSFPVPISTIIQIGASVQSSYWGFSLAAGYKQYDTLKPGVGYWVKMSQAGQLTMQSGPFIAPSASSYETAEATRNAGIGQRAFFAPQTEVIGEFTFADREATTRYLYVVKESAVSDGSVYQLPPPAPQGIMDVRFTNDRAAESVDASESREVAIQISSAIYPLKLSWKLKEHVDGIRLVIGSHTLIVNHTGGTVIQDPDARLRLGFTSAAGSTVPLNFALLQNFPNPFNPSTLLKYELPTESNVRLTIYNVLGQTVATLIDGIETAGYKSVEWSATGGSTSGVASGIYFYKFEAAGTGDAAKSFRQVKKMILVR